ncbi:MAG TPA: hypothetical protein ENJ56_07245 [Anaerolineae bacterium]|nr:hypothetical protein [Anaerolineae bacterium]
MFIGSMYGIISLATFQIGTRLLPNHKIRWKLLLLFAAIITALNGAALGLIGFPHIEIAIPALILLFLALYFTDKKVGSILVFIALLSIREDAGFQLAGLLIILLLSQYVATRDFRKLPKLLMLIVLLAILYSIFAIYIQKTYFPGDNALQRVYLGNPPLAHLSLNFYVEAAKFLVQFREYLYFPVLFTLIMAYYNRNIFLLSALLAIMPWILLSVSAVNNMPRELSNYYVFPFITFLAWPIYAFVINRRVNALKTVRYSHLASTVLMVTGVSIILFSGNLGNADAAPWYWFTFEYRQYVDKIDAFIAYNASHKTEFGQVLYDDSTATLMISQVTRKEFSALNQFRAEQLADVESLIFNIPYRMSISSADILDVVEKVVVDNQLDHICKVENTYLMVATNKPSGHLFDNELLTCTTHLLPLSTELDLIEQTALPAAATVINREFATGIELVAYQIENMGTRPYPGQFIDVTLYWQATGEASQRRDPLFVLSLMDDTSGMVLAQFERWLDPSIAPVNWPTDKLYTLTTTLQMPEDELPAKIALRVGTSLDGMSGITLAEATTAGNTLKLDAVNAVHPQAILFGGAIELVEHTVTVTEDLLMVDLVWEAVAQPSADYTVFVHLLDKNGELVAQYDRVAGGQRYPSSTWQQGDYYRDSFPVIIPTSAEFGTYQLAIGMYQWPSLDPILITDISGDLVETLILSEVEIDRR